MTELTIDRPITGDVSYRTTNRVPQQGPGEFLDAIDNLLAQDGVLSVHWIQYTPYFNDGEPCEFSAHELYVRLDDRFIPEDERLSEDEEWGDDYIEDRPGIVSSYNLRKTNWSAPGRPGWSDREADAKWIEEHSTWEKLNGQDTEAIGRALLAVNLSAFENVLQDNFGDPAEVTATREGFRVEYYEHD